MKERILKVNYLIDGILSVIPTKVIYKKSDKNEIENIHYEVILENKIVVSEASDVTELAIINLQKVLPSNISIACCQSCRYGNFCPYGDYDNEVFCLKDMKPNDKNEVCDFFTENQDSLGSMRRKLLDFCKDYKPISHNEYFTYNDWGNF